MEFNQKPGATITTSPLPPSKPTTSPILVLLLVDFSYRKFQAYITAAPTNTSSSTTPITTNDSPLPNAPPIYIVDFRAIRSPHIIVRAASSDSSHPLPSKKSVKTTDPNIVGTGILPAMSVNAPTTVRGLDAQLAATSRFLTRYTHLSRAFAPSNGGVPLTMTWASASDFKTWDFICSDPRTNTPVARFSAAHWAVKKVGRIEFIADDGLLPDGVDALLLRDEIATVGITLFYLMVLRASNILAFFAAVFYSPGKKARGNREMVAMDGVGSGGGNGGVEGKGAHGQGDGKDDDGYSDASDEDKWGAKRLEEEKRDEELGRQGRVIS